MSLETLRALVEEKESLSRAGSRSSTSAFNLESLEKKVEMREKGIDSNLESSKEVEAPEDLSSLLSLGPRPILTPPGTPYKATQQEVLLIGQTNRLKNQNVPLDAPLVVKYVAWANLKKLKSPPDAIGAYIAMSGNKPDFENPQGWKPLSTGDKFFANAIQAYL